MSLTSYLKCHLQVTNDKCLEKAILSFSFSGEDAIENDKVVYLEAIDESAIPNWKKKLGMSSKILLSQFTFGTVLYACMDGCYRINFVIHIYVVVP